MNRKTKITIAAALVVLMCGFVFYMSAKPALDSDEMSLGIVDVVLPLIVQGFDALDEAARSDLVSTANHIVRKLAHFSEFALLSMLMFNLVHQVASLREEKRTSGKRNEGEPGSVYASRGEPLPAQSAGSSRDKLAAAYAGASEEREDKLSATARASRGKPLPTPPAAAAAWVLTTLYAATDEFHQLFVPGRACLATDVAIDSSGALLGAAIAFAVAYAVVRRMNRS